MCEELVAFKIGKMCRLNNAEQWMVYSKSSLEALSVGSFWIFHDCVYLLSPKEHHST